MYQKLKEKQRPCYSLLEVLVVSRTSVKYTVNTVCNIRTTGKTIKFEISQKLLGLNFKLPSTQTKFDTQVNICGVDKNKHYIKNKYSNIAALSTLHHM